MEFGPMDLLRGAKGKIVLGIVVALLGSLAVLASPNETDMLLCTALVVLGGLLIGRGIQQSRQEKDALRRQTKGGKHAGHERRAHKGRH